MCLQEQFLSAKSRNSINNHNNNNMTMCEINRELSLCVLVASFAILFQHSVF